MSQINVQFSVASHIMVALGMHEGDAVRSAVLANSVNADPTFVRRVVSKLAKAGLVTTARGKGGACALARQASAITMLDIYKASAAPATVAMHDYPVEETCKVSRNIRECMDAVLREAQDGFEQQLARQSLAAVIASLKRHD